MTVYEAIQELSKYPPNAKISCSCIAEDYRPLNVMFTEESKFSRCDDGTADLYCRVDMDCWDDDASINIARYRNGDGEYVPRVELYFDGKKERPENYQKLLEEEKKTLWQTK